MVGHAYIRWVEIDIPVQVGSLVVHPGDLVHCDEHGCMVIPSEIRLRELLSFVHKFLASEKTVVDYCQSVGDTFSISEVCRLMDKHNKRTSGHM